jgi:hypothetical protein
MSRRRGLVLGIAAVGLVAAVAAWQMLREPGADRAYDTRVEAPALRERHPRVYFDHGHHNLHSLSGRYKPFGNLIASDGCRVRQISTTLTPDLLGRADVLVIVNAQGAKSDRTAPAFSQSECVAVRDWVRSGGALLLVADHHPCGEAAKVMAAAFGVEMTGGWTVDSTLARPGSGDLGQLVFTRENGGLADHPITWGDSAHTRVDTVETFTGQSLQGPPGCVPLLLLAEDAVDQIPVSSTVEQHGSQRVTTFQTEDRPATGRCQGLALHVGRGRVVVLGEAAMLTAQVDRDLRFGMNAPGNDNRAFALNVIRWLAGTLGD